MTVVEEIPQWNDFSVSRIREATSSDLQTSGHLLSHNLEEIRTILEKKDLSSLLVLDDTSFSGTTSLLIESLIRSAFPKREINFTHAFLILNAGSFGENPGAKSRLNDGSRQTVGGMEMMTPRDDGWHFFDLLKHEDTEQHFKVLTKLLMTISDTEFKELASIFLSDEEMLRTLFPGLISADELNDLEKTGHFLSKREIKGGFHVKNPQLMPNIIEQGHLLKIKDWKATPEEVFPLLMGITQLLKKEKI